MRSLKFWRRDPQAGHELLKLRYADEWTGILVIVCIAVFALVVIQAGLVRDWLTPSGKLHFRLPESGVAGLAVGNDVELMGINIGKIQGVKINRDGRMYAIAEVDPQFEPFIRDDSAAIIRRRFVVAGASYIELTQGHRKQLDWDFAELTASLEPNPADMIVKTINETRSALIPTLEQAHDIIDDIHTMTRDMRAGKGSVGGLLVKDDLLTKVQSVLRNVDKTVARLPALEESLYQTSQNLRVASPHLASTLVNVDQASAQLPDLLMQTQATTLTLRQLLLQMKSLWILGGGKKPDPSHLPVEAITP